MATQAAGGGGGGGGWGVSAPANTSVYWVGADGNIYLKSATGVQNVGSANGTGISAGANNNYGLTSTGFESNSLGQSVQAKQIADPNAPAPVIPANNSAGSTSTAPAVADKSNDIALQEAGLGSVDTQTQAGLDAIDKALGTLTGQYDTEKTANEGAYTTSSNQNENNLQSNKESALVNAAQGRQGLFGTLASLGALNGSGVTLANNAVQTGANKDLSGAGDNFATNQSGLDTAIGTFRDEDAKRRQDAADAAANAKTNAQNEAAKSKQTFYSNLANDYSAEGDAGNATKFTGLASALYPQVAATSIPDSTIAPEAAAFTAPSLANYLVGGNSTAVTAAPTSGQSGIPGLQANTPLKKKVVTV